MVNSNSQALVRINQSFALVRKHLDEKKKKKAPAVHYRQMNGEGIARGRKAAYNVNLTVRGAIA